MKRVWKQLLSLFVAAAMVVTLVPVGPSEAAIEYFHFDNFSTDKDSPTQVNTSAIELGGTFNGVSPNTISYQVDLVTDSGDLPGARGTGISPIIDGNHFSFANVEIQQGLNRITVTGTASGNTVSGICYVYYTNVPTIYDVKLIDGRLLKPGEISVVDNAPLTLLLKAPNATSVTVQGKAAFFGGDDSYIVSDIALAAGLNTLVITASNATMTYSITRDVVYYAGMPTAYSVSVDNSSGDPEKTKLDGNPTVGPNITGALEGTIGGYVIVQKNQALPAGTLPTITVDVQANGSSILPGGTPLSTTATFVQDVSVTGATYGYSIYQFATDIANEVTVSTSGDYSVNLAGSYGSTSIAFPVQFTYRNANSPYITGVRQLYNVTENAGVVSYKSSSLFTDNQLFFQLPLWIAVSANNFGAGDTASLLTSQGGVDIGSPAFTATQYTSANGEIVFKITNMPAGEQALKLSVSDGSDTDSKLIPITYVPTPFIQLQNLYNGEVFKAANLFTSIKGKLVNFNLTAGSPDLNSVQITINGTTKPLPAASITAATGDFTFNVTDPTMQLVDGPNNITITGLASGIPVTTHITVYLFSDTLPKVVSITPVPVGAASDTDNKFAKSGDLAYTTNEKNLDVLFSVVDADQVVVNIDGVQYVKTILGSFPNSENSGLLTNGSLSGNKYSFRLLNVPLPASGVKSITITAVKGTATGSQTLQITRIRLPYILLSPKLPEEQVVNQNFLKVSIKAEGADQILIGKEEMIKGSDDIFRLDINDLKSGNNTIKFTITTGTSQVKDQFTVNYAAQNEIGAQYKASMPRSGKLSVFNGAVSIAFPKGTMLKKPELKSLTNTPKIDLFDSQKLLFGIADPADGRTVKKYNRVGEFINSVPQDGTFADIPAMSNAVTLLQASRAHFGYASELFWIDAGYFKSGTTTFETVDGMQPYSSGSDQFFIRNMDIYKWLVPTNRGTITMRYDKNIRDVAASNLSIWRFSNNAWKNLGGVVDAKKQTVTAAFDGFGYYAVFSVRYGFEDIIGHRYARNYLDAMFAKGIMEPKSVNQFGVYDNITRGEFATMVVKMLDLPLNYDTSMTALTFSDVPPVSVPGTLWDYRYIETAARAGIISGIGPRTFNPGGFLTREQAAVMISRALNLKIGDPDKDRNSLTKSFVDVGLIDYYAVSQVLAVTKDKIMSGQLNPLQQGQKKQTYSFNPQANLNRADMAIIAYNVMKKLKKI